MSFIVDKNDESLSGNVRVLFTQTDRDTQEKKKFDYKI